MSHKHGIYLVGPDALHAGETSHAAAHLHILVRGVHLLQALADVGHHPAQHLPAHDDARAAHAEVLPGLQRQLAQFVAGAHARLAQKDGLAAVQTPQEALQLLALDVDVIVGSHEPLELVQVVVVHVLEHHEGLLLRRVRVVHVLQGHDGDGDRRVGTLAGEKLHFAGNGFGPGPTQEKEQKNIYVMFFHCFHL